MGSGSRACIFECLVSGCWFWVLGVWVSGLRALGFKALFVECLGVVLWELS